MNQMANDAKNCPQNGRRQWRSKSFNQIAHVRAQSSGDFHKRIHRRRFFSALNTTDEDGRKVCFFSQFFLGEIGLLRWREWIPQKTTVLLTDRHDGLKNGKQGKSPCR